MKENMPNIFQFATKELSQDAMICWLLECAKSKNSRIQELGQSFLRFLVSETKMGQDISVYKVEQQVEGIDVLTVLLSGERAYPIIIEDKTDTSLRENQVKKYCTTIRNWMKDGGIWLDEINKNVGNNEDNIKWGKLQFIFFKTGYVTQKDIAIWEKQIEDEQEVEFQFVSLDRKDDRCFPNGDKYKKKSLYDDFIKQYIVCQDVPEIFQMYVSHLDKIHSEREGVILWLFNSIAKRE